MSDDVLQVLRSARNRIAWGWTKKASARDRSGTPVTTCDPRACSFCALGAILVSCETHDDPETGGFFDRVVLYVRRVIPESYPPDVIIFNDHPYTTRDDVLRMFDKAIARAEREAS